LFGFGLYIDNYSRDVTVAGNTIISSTSHGILYQNSTGTVTGNTLYNNSRTSSAPAAGGAAQVYVGASPAYVSAHTDNVLYGLRSDARTLSLNDAGRLGTSDRNYFFNPYWANNIRASGDRSLVSWRTYSGKDANSKAAWFSQAAGEPPRSRILYNDTAQTQTTSLGRSLYLDLDQNEVRGSLTLQPYTSRVLIYNGEVSMPDLSTSTQSVWPVSAKAGERITYTVVIRNQGAAVTITTRLTDTVPSGLGYLSGTLTTTLGSVNAGSAPTLYWSSVLSQTPAVTITYAVTVTVSDPQAIRNTAMLDAGAAGKLDLSAVVIANGRAVYLPLVVKH
jgi:uncharacterized repeat protein (TIGR01451 family)